MYEYKKGTFQFCFPGLLGIHRNPKWKDFLKPRIFSKKGLTSLKVIEIGDTTGPGHHETFRIFVIWLKNEDQTYAIFAVCYTTNSALQQSDISKVLYKLI